VAKLPPEFIRKGRFDEIFFVDLPGDAARAEILRIHLRKRKQDPATLDLEDVVVATKGFRGAEILQQDGHARERPGRAGREPLADPVVEVDHGIDVRIPGVQAIERSLDCLRRGDPAVTDGGCGAGGVEAGIGCMLHVGGSPVVAGFANGAWAAAASAMSELIDCLNQ
jgi:hypothetical protein